MAQKLIKLSINTVYLIGEDENGDFVLEMKLELTKNLNLGQCLLQSWKNRNVAVMFICQFVNLTFGA